MAKITKIDDERFLAYLEKAQRNLAYCYNCQAFDSGDLIWIFGKRQDMADFLSDLKIPEAYRSIVAEALSCPNCGTQMDIICEIGTKTDLELRIDKRWAIWFDKYEPKFQEFFQFLSLHPYLGVQHNLGREILKKMSLYPKCSVDDTTWYRARKVQAENILSAADMYPPDPKFVAIPEGRYNHFGQSVFYLSKSKEGAALEVLDDEEGISWVQEFKIEHADKILDLSPGIHHTPDPDMDIIAFGLIFGGIIDKQIVRSEGWKPEYFIPRFIADSAKFNSINGIKFKSTRHYDDNLVLFSWNKKNIIPVGEPSIITINKRQHEDF